MTANTNEFNLAAEDLDSCLKRLKLGHIRSHLEELLKQAETTGLTPRQVLCFFLQKEVYLRNEKGTKMRTSLAQFPLPAAFDNFDLSASSISKEKLAELSSCEFIKQGKNLLLFGPVGTGKTHLSIAIGRKAIDMGLSTVFCDCNKMLIDLAKARSEDRLEKRMNRLTACDLLIIDEIGMEPIVKDTSSFASFFYQIIVERASAGKSTIITTNKELSLWRLSLNNDVATTRAAIDHFCANTLYVALSGESYRLRGLKQAALGCDERARRQLILSSAP